MCVERCVTGTKMFSLFFISLRKIYFLFQKFHWVFCALTNINGIQWASLSTAQHSVFSRSQKRFKNQSQCSEAYVVCVCVCAHVHVRARTCFVAQSSCPAPCNPMGCSPPGSTAHGILHARILEWVVISYCRESSQSRPWTQVSYVSCIDRQILSHCTTSRY